MFQKLSSPSLPCNTTSCEATWDILYNNCVLAADSKKLVLTSPAPLIHTDYSHSNGLVNEKITVNGYYFNAGGQILLSCETDSANSICAKEPHWDKEKWSLLPTPFLLSKTLPVLQLVLWERGVGPWSFSHKLFLAVSKEVAVCSPNFWYFDHISRYLFQINKYVRWVMQITAYAWSYLIYYSPTNIK